MELDPNTITVAQLTEDFHPAPTLYAGSTPLSRQRVQQIIAADNVDHLMFRAVHYVTKTSWRNYRLSHGITLARELTDKEWTGDPDHHHTPTGAAKLLGITRDALFQQISHGAIATVKLDGYNRLTEREIARYLREQSAQTGNRSPRYGHKKRAA